MRAETSYFTGVSVFFAGNATVYGWFSGDPAGTVALSIACGMSGLIAFFLFTQYRRVGRRPEDRRDGEVRERSGRLDFFPPHSVFPVVTAAGMAVLALGVVFGLWLALIGVAVLAMGVGGFVFQYPPDRG